MDIIRTNDLTTRQKEQIVNIWNAEYPVALKYTDIYSFEQYLATLRDPVNYVVNAEDGRVVGWLGTFIDMRRDGLFY